MRRSIISYEAAGLGLALLGGALILAVVSGTIGAITGRDPETVAAALLVIPFGIGVLAAGVAMFVVPFLAAGFAVSATADKARGYREASRPGLPPHNWRPTWSLPPSPRDCRNCGTPWNSVPFKKGTCQDRRACAGRLATYGWVGE